MTTATILITGVACILIFALINAILWLLEAILAVTKYLFAYLRGKQHNFLKGYLDVRILFTQLLLKVSYAMLSPRQIVRYRSHINKRTKNRLIQRDRLIKSKIKKLDQIEKR